MSNNTEKSNKRLGYNQSCQPVFTKKSQTLSQNIQIAVLRHIHIKHS